ATTGPIGLGPQPVELGVADAGNAGRFLLAIEFDGPTYHGAATVRDRDRLRRESLEKLGWRHHRVWSAAWMFRREEEIERLLRAVEEARKHAASNRKPTPPKSSPRPSGALSR